MTPDQVAKLRDRLTVALGVSVGAPDGSAPWRWSCPACGAGDGIYRPLVLDGDGLRCEACHVSERWLLAGLERCLRLEDLEAAVEGWCWRALTAENELKNAEARAKALEERLTQAQARIRTLQGMRAA